MYECLPLLTHECLLLPTFWRKWFSCFLVSVKASPYLEPKTGFGPVIFRLPSDCTTSVLQRHMVPHTGIEPAYRGP